MASPSVPHSLAGAARPSATLDRLSAALDLPALVAAGWDPAVGVWAPDPAHRLVGYAVCAVEGCASEARRSEGLCSWCAERRNADGASDLTAFCARGLPPRRRSGESLCLVCRVPGATRPAAARGLCLSCNHLRMIRGQSVDAYLCGDDSFAPALPRPSIGICAVISCGRLAAHAGNHLCAAHDTAWRAEGRPDLEAYCRRASPRRGERRGRVVLRGLPEEVITELLHAIGCCLAEGRHAALVELRGAVDHCRRLGVNSLADIDVTGKPGPAASFLRFAANRSTLASSTPQAEQAKDVWDLRVWGQGGRLSFIGDEGLHRHAGDPVRPISQDWLKAAAKAWAAEALVSKTSSTVAATVSCVGLLSEHLGARPNRGADPGLLGRRDLEGFLAHLARLEAAGNLSRPRRTRVVDSLAQFLRDCRALGLTHPGAVMGGLADDVVFRRRDHPATARREGDDAGRALPETVMAQLLSAEALGLLEAMSGPGTRAAVELQAGVGRRTAELCQLAWSCLDYDQQAGADGQARRNPVLVHDMPKVGKAGCRLPIHDREARIIAAQQARVRAAFPGTPAERLALFPRIMKNPDGTKPIPTGWLQRAVRDWVDALPSLDRPERDSRGQPIPFPREAVFPYAFRHSFAQRHADAGTPVDTLKDLLGHDTVRTTLGYYRVTARRKREAQDRLGALQLDAQGHLVRPGVAGLTDTDALRDQVGQVAVPFGTCTEPANVAAGGRSCPFRHRCTGCEYFRTDPSYQPELSAYLTRLLADRERLVGALPQLADWARRDAVPSDEEIDAVRRLLRANDEALAALDDNDRAAVEAAISTMRKQRAMLDATFPFELHQIVAQPAPALFPAIEAASRAAQAHG